MCVKHEILSILKSIIFLIDVMISFVGKKVLIASFFETNNDTKEAVAYNLADEKK